MRSLLHTYKTFYLPYVLPCSGRFWRALPLLTARFSTCSQLPRERRNAMRAYARLYTSTYHARWFYTC